LQVLVEMTHLMPDAGGLLKLLGETSGNAEKEKAADAACAAASALAAAAAAEENQSEEVDQATTDAAQAFVAAMAKVAISRT